jgi:energy-coupling factor transporter ATP-binding protein EcfA2
MTDKKPLVIENLNFRYHSRETLAIKNISLSVDAGQVLLIAGASGCGKTTLARCINGLIPRSYKGELTGKILLKGNEVTKLSLAQVSQIVGTVLQDPERQILGTKVANEVAFGLENLSLPREEIVARVSESLEHLKIPHLLNRETFHLSGGEKQKVALAGVLAMHPSILLLDEPLASLDPASAQDALDIIRSLADEGMTVLMVEHRVEDVLRIHPENAIFMMDGEIKYYGPTSGFDKTVDYHEVKLPAAMIMERAKVDPAPERLTTLRKNSVVGSVGKTGEALVKFEDISFWYDENQPVLHDVNLTIHRGDVIAVLGPNGAGKTTLVKHAIGLLKPKSGHMIVEGKDSKETSVAQIAQTLGYVFQSPSHMLFAPTVEEELSFGPTNLKHPAEEIKKDVEKAINIVNLAGMEKYPPLALSFGQQKRVSIASILAMRSKILVMDEPTAGQDYKNYLGFMDAILQMPGFDAILFITHDIDMAVIYANRVIMVNGGTVVCDGTPAEALKDFDFLKQNRLVPTSLLKMNLDLYSKTGRFYSAEELAHVVQ